MPEGGSGSAPIVRPGRAVFAGPANCTETRVTAPGACGDGSPLAGSDVASPAKASSHPDVRAGAAASWNGPGPGCRRLHGRYERKSEHFLALTAIAATLICHHRIAK